MVMILSESHRIILQEVNKIRAPVKMMGTSLFIICPHPEHRDTAPSCGVNLDPHKLHNGHAVSLGFWHCFGCGRKGRWNELAEYLGLAKVKAGDDVRKFVGTRDFEGVRKRLLVSETKDLQAYADGFGSSLHIEFPQADDWRGIRGELLGKIGARLIFDSYSVDNAVLLPVEVQGEIVGCIKATMEKDEDQKWKLGYLNSPGAWTREQGLFPFDYTVRLMKRRGLTKLVLTEGPRDSLRILQYGVPAMSILGTNNWSAKKLELLASLGFDIVLMFDGDQSGVKASNKIGKHCREFGLAVEVIKLKRIADRLGRKVDPANCPLSVVRDVKEIVYG